MLTDTKYDQPRIKLPNYWRIFLEQNYNLLPDDCKNVPSSICGTVLTPYHIDKPYDYHFKLDGYEAPTYHKIVSTLKTKEFCKLEIDPKLKKKIRFIFYYITEGESRDEIFDLIYWMIDIHGLNYQQVVFLNIALNLLEIYENYCVKNNITDDKKIIVKSKNIMNNSNLLVYNEPKNLIPIVNTLQEKKFAISLNWAPRQHRFLILGFLLGKDLHTDMYLTFPTWNRFTYDVDLDFRIFSNSIYHYYQSNDSVIFESFEKMENWRHTLLKYKKFHPFIVDDRKDYKSVEESIVVKKNGELDSTVKTTVLNHRSNVLFELVNETHADGTLMITEKTFWPILAELPFFIFSSVGALHELRKYGYQTYSPYIDESYDTEVNLEKRAFMIVTEMEKLYKMRITDPDKFYNIYHKMKIVAKHNKELFLETKADYSDIDFVKN